MINVFLTFVLKSHLKVNKTAFQTFAILKELCYNMGILDGIIKIDENGILSYTGWVEWKHSTSGLLHCPVCMALDKCWFNNSLKPALPQHERCHCVTNNISKPIPYINSYAKCDLKKFTDYVFSDKYSWNGKRDLFETLGFTIKDSHYLKEEYEKQAVKKYCDSNYKLDKLDLYGQRINIDIVFAKNDKIITFTSGWMVKPKGEIINNTPLAD